MARADTEAERLIAWRYVRGAPLGSGGTGTTYRAEDLLRPGSEPVALKIVNERNIPILQAEFVRLRGLFHPHLQQVRDFVLLAEGGGAAIASEYVPGNTLSESRVTSWEAVRAIFADVASALAFLHESGVVHADVKPDNIIVRTSGETVEATLIDLSCSRPVNTLDDVVAGTPIYLAPERGAGLVTPTIDVYGFGRTLTEFIARSNVEVPEFVTKLTARCLATDPNERPRDGRALVETLRDHTLGTRAIRTVRSLVRSALVGRTEILTELNEWLEGLRHHKPVASSMHLHGPPGIGKSRLLQEACWRAQVHFRVLDVRAPHTRAAGSVISALVARSRKVALEDQRHDAASLSFAVQSLMETAAQSSEPATLWIVDDVEDLGVADRVALDSLRRILSESRGIGLLTADVNPASLAENRAIKPLAVEDIERWIGPSLPHVSARELHQQTGGAPGEVIHLLEATADDGDLSAKARPGLPLTAAESLVLALATGSPWPLPMAILRRNRHHDAVVNLVARGAMRVFDGTFALARASERLSLTGRFSSVLPRLHRWMLCPATERAAGVNLTPADQTARRLCHAFGAKVPHEGILEEAYREMALSAAAFLPLMNVPWMTNHVAGNAFLAALLETSGQPREALKRIASTIRHRPDAVFAHQLRLTAARAYTKLGHRRAVPTLRRALSEAPASNAPGIAVSLALALFRRGAYHAARELGEAYLERTEGRERVDLLLTMAQAASYEGNDANAKTLFDLAEAIPEARGSTAETRLHHVGGVLAMRRGDVARAMASFDAAVASARTQGLAELFVSSSGSLGALRHQTGDWGAAGAAYDAADRVALALGLTPHRLTLAFNAARLECDIGRFERVRQHLERAERFASESGHQFMLAACAALRAELATKEGDHETYETAYATARAAFSRLGASRECAEVLLVDAAYRAMRGERAAAQDALQEATSRLQSAPASELFALRDLVSAQLEGTSEQGVRLLEQARAHAERSGHLALLGAVRAALGSVYKSLDLPVLAAEETRGARGNWERILAGLSSDARHAFIAHPDRKGLFSNSDDNANLPTRGDASSERREVVRLRKLLAVNRTLSSAATTDEIVQAALDAAIELTSAEHGLVVLTDEAAAVRLHVARSRGGRVSDPAASRFSRGIAGRVLRSGEPVLSLDVSRDPRLRRNRSIHALDLKSVLAVPIRESEKLLGVLCLHATRPTPSKHSPVFTDDDVDTVTGFADQVAVALGRAALIDKLAAQNHALEAAKAENEALLLSQARQIVELESVEPTEAPRAVSPYFPAIIGSAPALKRVLDVVARVADADISLLVRGETGTGKELIARALHERSGRRANPFVALNCGALPEALLEAELFGYVKGAFTGAVSDKRGLFEAAEGGTLFLDEVGEMTSSLQVKLLRALQEREIKPLGSPRSKRVDVRIVSATHRDLREHITTGRFREDLYYRLAVVEVVLPPLRERVEDIPLLANRIMSRMATNAGRAPKTISPAAMRELLRSSWPGNIRELENVLTRAFFLSDGPTIEAFDLPTSAAAVPPKPALTGESAPPRGSRHEDAMRMREALVLTGWNVSEAARSLQIPRITFYRRMQRYKIERPE